MVDLRDPKTIAVLSVILGVLVFFVYKKYYVKESFYLVPQKMYDADSDVKNAVPAPFSMGVDKSKFLQGATKFRSYSQAIPPMEPRMGNPGYASQLVGAEPPYHVQGIPKEPLGDDFAKMIKQSAQFGDGAIEGYEREVVDQMAQKKYRANLEYTEPSELLPKSDMSGTAYGKIISDPQTYVTDRFIYANQKRRNNYGANRIFGDLPIQPHQTGWFQVSVKPHLDLVQGVVQGAMSATPDVETNDDGMGTISFTSARGDNALRFERFV